MLRRNYTGDHLSGRLTELVNQSLPTLGATTEGSAFVMKAINPFWQGICNGMPDKSSGNVVVYKFEQTFAIEGMPTAGPNDIIDHEINFHGDPIRFADVISTTRAAPTDISGSFTFLNNQMPIATATSVPPLPAPTGVLFTDTVNRTTANFLVKQAYWQAVSQHARLLYYGATLIQTASHDNDQGLLSAGQQRQSPIESVVLDPITGQLIEQVFYGPEDFADFSNIANLPRSYTGPSRDGSCIALKLADEYTQWTSQVTPSSCLSTTVGAAVGLNGSVPSPHQFIAIKNGTRGTKVMDGNLGQIFIRGVANTTSFQVRLRVGFEVRPFAGSSNTPFIIDSPRYDPMALETLSRLLLEVELDAYPADYNLFEWLGNAIRKIAPYLVAAAKGAMGGVSGGIPGMIMGGAKAFTERYDQEERDEQAERDKQEEIAKESRQQMVVVKPKRRRVEFVNE